MPAYNAKKYIKKTLERLSKTTQKLPAFKIFLVNDGSKDETERVFLETCRILDLVFSVIRNEKNMGYGASQKRGFKKALEENFDYFLLLHSDGQYAPEEMQCILRPLFKEKADMVLGSRLLSGRALKEGMPFSRYVANLWLTKLENAVFSLNFAEYHSGYMAYNRKTLETIKFETLTDKFHFDGEMLLSAGKLGLRVAQIPVSAHYGKNVSSLSPFPYLMEIAVTILRYLKKKYFFQKIN